MSEANRISTALLKRKLVASVNMFPVRSNYLWKNEIVRTSEVFMVMKTRLERFVEVKQAILALHSYEVPAVAAVKVSRANTSYLEWIDSIVRKRRGRIVHQKSSRNV